jgi:hypothetical protein
VEMVYVRSIGRAEAGAGGSGSGSASDAIQLARPQQVLIDESEGAKKEVAAWMSGRGKSIDGKRLGRLLVSDSINHRIGVFDLDGELVRWIGGVKEGTSDEQFLHPRGMKLLGDGTMLVVEFGRNRVQHVDVATGQRLGVYGQTGSGPGQLAEPWAIAVLGKMAYVVDARNNRLVRMRVP